MTSHDAFYDEALLYEVAFDFRDVPGEFDSLTSIHARHGRPWGRAPSSFLELAAGPADHALEAARRNLRSLALDLSPAMVSHGLARAAAEGLTLDYRHGDMTAFTLAPPVDLAAILMDSTSYLLDNDAVLAHLRCVARALVPGGIYVLEMGHPRDVFGVGSSAQTSWDASRGDLRVHVDWGAPDDPFDPTTQVTQTSVTLTWQDGDRSGTIRDRAPQRRFAPNELRALVTASGLFDLAALQGSLDPSVPFDDSPEAWRMVAVLRRRSPTP